MIRVNRNRPVPASEARLPVQPSDAWFIQAGQATRQAIAEGEAHEVTDLYRDPGVKTALEELFHGKCAYCESRPMGTSSWDVEHYRPKGKVTERADHPGYYWLAYTWTNLYLSCTLCNRRRRDPPCWDDDSVLPAAGKGSSFPLENEHDRAMFPESDLNREQPLLLDPCAADDDPEEHFTYDARGRVCPRDNNDQRARATIALLHLNRRRLQRERERIYLQVMRVMAIKEMFEGQDVGVEGEFEDFVADCFLSDEALYAGVARAVVRDFQTNG